MPKFFWLPIPLAICSVLLTMATLPAHSHLRVGDLRCEYLVDPVGIDISEPRLSWRLTPPSDRERGLSQKAYRVLAASSRDLLEKDQGDLWDSGEIDSDQSHLIAYRGVDLISGMEVWWKVRVWDAEDEASEWSPPAHWRMGLLQASDWKGKWIGLERYDQDPESPAAFDSSLPFPPARYLRNEFEIEKPFASAVLSVAGMGSVEIWINGNRVGDHVLDPVYSDNLKRVFYSTFEVEDLLREGTNSIGVILGNGRALPLRDSFPNYGFPKVLVQLDLKGRDGEVETHVSDGSWRLTTRGPIRDNQEYDGETQDFRMDLGGWLLPGYEATDWIQAETPNGPAGRLAAQAIEPLRITETVTAVAITHPTPGVHIFDLGQNIVGWARLRAREASGARIEMRHAETLDKAGFLDTRNLRSAKAADTFILGESGEQILEPRFTYHGFRYVEVRGLSQAPEITDLEGLVVHSDLERIGSFNCSHPLLNRLHENMVWGIRGNLRGVPTDCPQRDERQGWLGDIAIESKGESYDFQVARFFLKWLEDIQLAQNEEGSLPDVAPPHWDVRTDNVTWPSTYLIIPGWFYEHYGDIRVLEQHYPSMKRWIAYMERFREKGLMPRDQYGDWCVPPEDPTLIHSKDPARKTPGEFIGTAYFYKDLLLLSEYADKLGLPQEAIEFRQKAEEFKEAFNDTFFDNETGIYANGTQTSSILPLAFGMVPEESRQSVFRNLVANIEEKENYHLGTGLIGCQWLMRTLSHLGRPDLALTLATQTTYPSWGYMVEHGATTIWELWNGDTADPGMNSHNHLMLIGDLGLWLYEGLAGIQPDPTAPGFKHFSIDPLILEGLEEVDASTRGPYGIMRSHWRKESNQLSLEVEVPPNSSATVSLPCLGKAAGIAVQESGVSIWQNAGFISGVPGIRSGCREGEKIRFEVGSGTYRFSWAVNP
jgi:alpha-L-rhamnosidase